MINERSTEKYSAIYYGIIREGVKKMIRARISQTQKEFKGVQIKQKVSSLDQFGLGRITENEMQFGEKIYENNKKYKYNQYYVSIFYYFHKFFLQIAFHFL